MEWEKVWKSIEWIYDITLVIGFAILYILAIESYFENGITMKGNALMIFAFILNAVSNDNKVQKLKKRIKKLEG